MDAENVTFGIRSASFNNATGFSLNGVRTKLKGFSNHQDFAAVGVAVPDHLQWNRISTLKACGANAWRTAHNPPAPALLHAADELGFLVMDEDHKNGEDSETPLMVLRDRNHPSVILWSVCNEKLCTTGSNSDSMASAKKIVEIMHALDPSRPVTANSRQDNPLHIGPSTSLDVAGYDYSTENYDSYHLLNPSIPSLATEASSAYSDRGEWVTTKSHVSPYNEFPIWGQSAEAAWGGINISNGQGIMTRDFIAGGMTWTGACLLLFPPHRFSAPQVFLPSHPAPVPPRSGHDYRGEETPLGWPTVSSHFGAIDSAGFPKDRFFYYQSIFLPSQPFIHVFPHWSFAEGEDVPPIWVYSSLPEAEVFVNNVSIGRKPVPQYSHAAWENVTFHAGSLRAVGYAVGSSTPAAEATRVTAGAPEAIRLTFKDAMGAGGLVAACGDAALIAAEVVDGAGVLVPNASHNITFTLRINSGDSGALRLEGTANGDPACHVNNKSPTRPAFHGLAVAVVVSRGGGECSATIVASAPGLPEATIDVSVARPGQSWGGAAWCPAGPTL